MEVEHESVDDAGGPPPTWGVGEGDPGLFNASLFANGTVHIGVYISERDARAAAQTMLARGAHDPQH